MDVPITGFGIVADRTKAPYSYVVLDKTSDGLDDADLWKDGFIRRSYRYISYSKDPTCADFLIGIQIINEREEVPTGFVVVESTLDSHERATKKKLFCVKFVPRVVAKTVISDINILGRTKKIPTGYTMISEFNNLVIACKFVNLPNGPRMTNGIADCRTADNTPKISEFGSMTLGRTATPLSGVPFSITKKFANYVDSASRAPFSRPMEVKTLTQIEYQYEYNFAVENSVLRDQ